MFGGSHAHVLVEEGMGLSANHRALHQSILSPAVKAITGYRLVLVLVTISIGE